MSDKAYKFSTRDDTTFRVAGGDVEKAYKYSVRDNTDFRVGGGADSDAVGTGQVDYMTLKS